MKFIQFLLLLSFVNPIEAHSFRIIIQDTSVLLGLIAGFQVSRHNFIHGKETFKQFKEGCKDKAAELVAASKKIRGYYKLDNKKNPKD